MAQAGENKPKQGRSPVGLMLGNRWRESGVSRRRVPARVREETGEPQAKRGHWTLPPGTSPAPLLPLTPPQGILSRSLGVAEMPAAHMLGCPSLSPTLVSSFRLTHSLRMTGDTGAPRCQPGSRPAGGPAPAFSPARPQLLRACRGEPKILPVFLCFKIENDSFI